MARGIALIDTEYEIDNSFDIGAAPAIAGKCLIRMDKHNIGTGTGLIKPTTNTAFIAYPFHTSIRKNEREFGIHPRHVIGELVISSDSSACYGTTPIRRVVLPVLTLAQFNAMVEFNKVTNGKGQTKSAYTILVNHSHNGATKLEYRIVSKVPQKLI